LAAESATKSGSKASGVEALVVDQVSPRSCEWHRFWRKRAVVRERTILMTQTPFGESRDGETLEPHKEFAAVFAKQLDASGDVRAKFQNCARKVYVVVRAGRRFVAPMNS